MSQSRFSTFASITILQSTFIVSLHLRRLWATKLGSTPLERQCLYIVETSAAGRGLHVLPLGLAFPEAAASRKATDVESPVKLHSQQNAVGQRSPPPHSCSIVQMPQPGSLSQLALTRSRICLSVLWKRRLYSEYFIGIRSLDCRLIEDPKLKLFVYFTFQQTGNIPATHAYPTEAMVNGTGSCEWSPNTTGVE